MSDPASRRTPGTGIASSGRAEPERPRSSRRSRARRGGGAIPSPLAAAHACVVVAVGLVPGVDPARAQSATPSAGIDPYYVGSLLSPDPALSRAGAVSIQPTVAHAIQSGAFDAGGVRRPAADGTRALLTSTSIRYALTDTITAQFIPTTAAIFGPQGFGSGSQVGDTAVDLDVLLMRGDLSGRPGIAASVGLDLPTGRYERLANASDGFGAGTVRARFSVIAQSVLFGSTRHPVRVRAYADGEAPLASVPLHGFTTYGTDGAFDGFGRSGASATVGVALEYSFTRKLVFAFDVFQGFDAANRVHGVETTGAPAVFTAGAASTTQIAPALEYSFSDDLGVVVGVALGVAGRNGPATVTPQIEMSRSF